MIEAALSVEVSGSSESFCDCCGAESRKLWGEVLDGQATAALYYIQWTVGSPNHFPNLDLVIGPWGEGFGPADRFLVSLLYRPDSAQGGFMVVDAEGRYANYLALCEKAFDRSEVVGTALASKVFSIVDAIWLGDPRLSDVKSLGDVA
ncbi:hypothetical protein [Pseudomarimonas salicorniae]|uniref:Uncharacterized protein n=1 Tax=Pseudomarimonas salicorniae TaxID=2933270 RepID=A0ABT0GM71_9GAMM|nr:hypothetical protein [Lysobacter sp. CAU 1642]MCK7595643.1 hypothetical protein [Lysobacter sp. CAU 1642]